MVTAYLPWDDVTTNIREKALTTGDWEPTSANRPQSENTTIDDWRVKFAYMHETVGAHRCQGNIHNKRWCQVFSFGKIIQCFHHIQLAMLQQRFSFLFRDKNKQYTSEWALGYLHTPVNFHDVPAPFHVLTKVWSPTTSDDIIKTVHGAWLTLFSLT